MCASLCKRFFAELFGTWMLVVVGAGAAAVTLLMANGEPVTSGFNIGIGALGGLADWMAIGMAFAIVIAGGIYAFGPISGAHFNPAVTIALWASRRFPGKDVVPYIVAQVLGATIGAATLLLMLGPDGSIIGGLGAPGPFPGISTAGVFAAELIGTFILMLVIMGTAVDDRAPRGLGGLMIGLTVAGVIITMGNISGQGINPARSLGPFIMNSIAGGPNAWSFSWIYIIAPIIGAILAAFCYDVLIKCKKCNKCGQYDIDFTPGSATVNKEVEE